MARGHLRNKGLLLLLLLPAAAATPAPPVAPPPAAAAGCCCRPLLLPAAAAAAVAAALCIELHPAALCVGSCIDQWDAMPGGQACTKGCMLCMDCTFGACGLISFQFSRKCILILAN